MGTNLCRRELRFPTSFNPVNPINPVNPASDPSSLPSFSSTLPIFLTSQDPVPLTCKSYKSRFRPFHPSLFSSTLPIFLTSQDPVPLTCKSHKSCKSRFRPFQPSLLFFHPSHLPNLPRFCPSHPGTPQPPVPATPDRIPPQGYHQSPPSPSHPSDTPQ